MSAPGFWNMTEEIGSMECACDPDGAFGIDCNELTGQCDCKPGRGGRTCADCEDLFYGDPNDQCIPCDCDPQGSIHAQCDRKSGQCVCRVGISGFKCDRCDRGTTGVLPNCVPCGDCFDNWDRVIRDLRGKRGLVFGHSIGLPLIFKKKPLIFVQDAFLVIESLITKCYNGI